MKISIFGTGYVGLVTGTCLAEIGHDVMCVDIDQAKIDGLMQGEIPIYEPGLEELVLRNVKEGRLSFTTDALRAIDYGQVIFSAVGTPPDKNHKADLQYVKTVARTVGLHMTENKVFVNKSTVPVGTGAVCKKIIEDILVERGETCTVSVVSNPEFLKEGSAIKDFMLPDRIVCGVESDRAQEMMRDVYSSFVRAQKPLVFMDVASAELVKYAANAFLATKISFINEIANFSEYVGADVQQVAKGMGMDDRIGSRFLHAGIGYGGSCFPKDVQALIHSGRDVGYNFRIVDATEQVNASQKMKVVEKLSRHIHDLQGKRIALRGLSFKPKTDDVRDAPSLLVCRSLLDQGVEKITCFDPEAMKSYQCMFGADDRVVYVDDRYAAVVDADALLLLTERDEFRVVDMDKVKELMRGQVIVDGRNIRCQDELTALGFIYEGIGKREALTDLSYTVSVESDELVTRVA